MRSMVEGYMRARNPSTTRWRGRSPSPRKRGEELT